MGDNQYKSYADCIGCKSNNLIEIIKDYITKYNNPEIKTKYNQTQEDLFWSMRFLLANVETYDEYYNILISALEEGTKKLIDLVLSFEFRLDEKQTEEAKKLAEKIEKQDSSFSDTIRLIEEKFSGEIKKS